MAARGGVLLVRVAVFAGCILRVFERVLRVWTADAMGELGSDTWVEGPVRGALFFVFGTRIGELYVARGAVVELVVPLVPLVRLAGTRLAGVVVIPFFIRRPGDLTVGFLAVLLVVLTGVLPTVADDRIVVLADVRVPVRRVALDLFFGELKVDRSLRVMFSKSSSVVLTLSLEDLLPIDVLLDIFLSLLPTL